ncbi:geranylgeranyl transferase type II alpha subunit [Nannizzia gypsea CBS 118893]|uniref:Geranylgeranyl transferase type-2 subunit alpha n=1 Tax=Arthroderma gypseum (strain ATCC MYA-4604 / CBS 118893) TaxID=535722 RepID=E4V1I1_ARTGP|nr:geranylgeranyl transferase type II alpha subunit [Nannizzia gypsea CBS 118893]EFR03896.1 geranylgeranyl transferase type II alpha subunit [Nannizzia gypsea CBS 118893]
MSSHGVLRQSSANKRTEAQRQAELKAIDEYHTLDKLVLEKKEKHDFSKEAFDKTSELLLKNAEYYTIWNYRRMILQSMFVERSTQDEGQPVDQTQKLIQQDLGFLVPLLQKNPKCYWIWNHRLWLLQQATERLEPAVSRNFWETELGLVGKMLNRDGRNFHGWGYRRAVVDALESIPDEPSESTVKEPPKSMTQDELEYTMKMIGTNLSNFSAWHNRSKLILKVLDESAADNIKRKKTLDNELGLIHRALIDPYDQSIWFYHQYLMSVCDIELAPHTMAPNLTTSDRLQYLEQEIEAIEDILEDTNDCKWIYQALITYTLLVAKINNQVDDMQQQRVSIWLTELMRLDPLRKGRWDDLKKSLATPDALLSKH